jgi:uncharacterized protein (DUF1786 family)
MKILCIDIGTGTQDILLFDSTTEVENCLQLVMPSPTVLVANRVRAATRRREPVILTGTIMGGGPSSWAAEDHVRAGLPIYATPEAALSFNDELDKVEASGIRVIETDEAATLAATRIELRDVDLDAVQHAFAAFSVPLEFDALAVAVFDHGNAPPGISDRTFRFEFLAERIRATGKLSGFAFMRDQIPERLTRMRAVAAGINVDLPIMVMDTAPAAVRGTLDDELVADHRDSILVNLGNFHTLAFRFTSDKITGVMEHHTGELKQAQLEGFLEQLAAGTLTNEQVFGSQGHGAVMFERHSQPLNFLAVTGPRRSMLLNSPLNPYFAVPYGDMMLAGDFGLLHAYADLNPGAAAEIEGALARSRASAPRARAS